MRWYNKIQDDMRWHDMIWDGIIWYKMIWDGIIWYYVKLSQWSKVVCKVELSRNVHQLEPKRVEWRRVKESRIR